MNPVPLELQRYIVANGRVFTPALLPPSIPRMERDKCFDNCAYLAAKNPDLRYVEGICKRQNGRPNQWILHAWLSDGTKAYDPTWLAIKDGKEVPVPMTYVGIEIDTVAMAKFMSKTEYAGILANSWRDSDLAERILPPGLPVEAIERDYDLHEPLEEDLTPANAVMNLLLDNLELGSKMIFNHDKDTP